LGCVVLGLCGPLGSVRALGGAFSLAVVLGAASSGLGCGVCTSIRGRVWARA
jgi:hypothetical protein